MVEEATQFLKKREIRTMQKDITRLREEEVKGEREKIIGLRTDEETKRRALEEVKREKEEKEKAEFLLKLKKMEEAEGKVEEAESTRRREMEKTKVAELLEQARKREEEIKKRVSLEKEGEKREREEEFLKRREGELRQRAEMAQVQKEKEEKERAEFLKRVAEERIEKPVPGITPAPTIPEMGGAKEEKFPPRARIALPKIEKPAWAPLISKAPPKRPSTFEKIFIRVLIIGFLVAIWAGIFTFWYWFFTREKPTPPSPPPVAEEKPVEKPGPVIPPSLIPAAETKTLEIASAEELKPKLSEFLKTGEFLELKFYRILIKNNTENKILNLKEFFEALQIKTPENFYQKLDLDFTLFLYPTAKYNRLGFIAKIKEGENFPVTLKSWEKTMEKDFENLFSLMNKEKPALIPYFRGAQYRGASFRFQTFTKEDLGICYSIFDDELIWASSWESLTKAIDLFK